MEVNRMGNESSGYDNQEVIETSGFGAGSKYWEESKGQEIMGAGEDMGLGLNEWRMVSGMHICWACGDGHKDLAHYMLECREFQPGKGLGWRGAEGGLGGRVVGAMGWGE